MHSFNLSVRLAFYFTMNMSWTCHCPWLILLETFCYHTIGVPTMKQEPFLTNVKQFWFAVGACITARIIWNNWYVQDRRKQRYIFSYGNVSITDFFPNIFVYIFICDPSQCCQQGGAASPYLYFFTTCLMPNVD